MNHDPAAAIARALGGTGQSRSGWHSCDCPVCHGDGKLGLKDSDDGLAVHCFKLCRRRYILVELQRLGLLAGVASEPEDPATAAARREAEALERSRRIAEAQDFIGQCLPWNTTGQIARYLRSRGLDPDLLSGTTRSCGAACRATLRAGSGR
jgi:hypothetical protein